MKKFYLILSAVIILIISACGGSPASKPDPEPVIPAISAEKYNSMVSDFNSRLMEESVILANVGMYEYNYWDAFSGLSTYGDLDYEEMAKKAMDWLAENSDATSETVKAAYDELIASYSAIAEANVDGDVPEDVPKLVDALFGAYHMLYSLVTEPSGEIDDFLLQLSEHSEAIMTFNEDLSSLLEGN